MNPHVYLQHTKGKNIFRLKYTQERSSTSRGKPGATKKVKNERVEVLQEQTLKTVPKHTQQGAPQPRNHMLPILAQSGAWYGMQRAIVADIISQSYFTPKILPWVSCR